MKKIVVLMIWLMGCSSTLQDAKKYCDTRWPDTNDEEFHAMCMKGFADQAAEQRARTGQAIGAGLKALGESMSNQQRRQVSCITTCNLGTCYTTCN